MQPDDAKSVLRSDKSVTLQVPDATLVRESSSLYLLILYIRNWPPAARKAGAAMAQSQVLG
jgi:hypothetical protein